MNQYKETTQNLCDFIKASPTCYHVVENASKMLKEQGFNQINEINKWKLIPGQSYYVTRSDSSLIAFVLPKNNVSRFQVIASHSDSPSFKIKESPEVIRAGHYVELNIEKYGGMLQRPWFDRPLGVAGRVCVYQSGIIKTILVDSKRDLLMIPSLAIHMDRKANESGQISVQSDMLPIFGDETADGKFMELIAELADVEISEIAGMDLFLYDRSACSFWGAGQEFFSSPRLDDQQCAYASIQAIINTWRSKVQDSNTGIQLCCVFDNEEVGSRTKQGADSTFLSDVMKRIAISLGLSDEEYMMLLPSSFMLSADNSHAVHPNHIDKADPVNQPVMNHGVVVKWNASQKYTTDAVSAAIFKTICRYTDVPVQDYVNHSDIPGGSTLGNISAGHVSVNCLDIGCAQLAMHSPYETAGVKDTLYMIKAMEAFYKSNISMTEDGYTVLNGEGFETESTRDGAVSQQVCEKAFN